MWKLGWLLNTLKYQIEKDLQETVYQSAVYQDNRWGPIERQVLTWSKHPFIYVMKLGAAFSLLTVAATMLKPYISQLVPGYSYDWNELIQWQSIFLSVQLTVIGVIFPLVIGLVGFLLQSKTASKAIWSVYNRYSGFLFTGFSGLFLAIFIILGKYLEPVVPTYWYLVLCGHISLWLIFNLCLTAWFLNATFKIIHESSRDELLLRFTINESFLDDIRKRLSILLPENAVERKLICLPVESKSKLETILFSRDGEFVFFTSHSKPVYVKNIYFRLLSITAQNFFRRAGSSPSADSAKLVLPLTVDNRSKRKHQLAVSNGCNLSWLDKWMLKFSYSFTTKQPYLEDTLNYIIFSLIGSAADELKSNNPKLFDESIKKLANWHCAVSDLLTFIDDNEQNNNWLLLPSSGFIGRSYLDKLLREYYLLAKQSVEKIPSTIEFYDELVHLHIKLHNWSKEKQPTKMTEELIYGNYLCWVALIDWAAVTDKPEGSSRHHQYEYAVLAYISAWETWPMYLKPRSTQWKESIAAVPLFIKHLICTAQQVIVAVRRDDVLASEWAIDMLIHWFSNISAYTFQHQQYRWNHELIVHTILERDRTDNLWQLILNQNPYDEISATQLALENAWIDTRLITACYLLSKPNSQGEETFNHLIETLLEGRRFKATGVAEGAVRPLNTGAEILSAYIRQRWYWDYQEGNYGNWLNSVVDLFNLIDEPKRVSGRVYSRWGATDVSSLNRFYVILAIKKSHIEWKIEPNWINLLFSDAVEQHHRESLISDLKKWLKIAKEELGNTSNLKLENVNNFIASVNSVITEISNRNQNAIDGAEIDENRLIEFGVSASKSAFHKETGCTLLSLFHSIITEDVMLEGHEIKINIAGYDKSDISKDIEVNRAINEDGWLDNIVNQSVSSNLFGALCRIKNTKTSEFDSNADLLKHVSADINLMKKENDPPLFFVNSWGVLYLLSDLSYGDSSSIDFNVDRRNGFGNDYICHIEGIPAYQMSYIDRNFCILISERSFESVSFTRFDEQRYVNVQDEDYDSETLKLTLVLSYFMKLDFVDAPSYRYISKDETND